MNPKRWLKLRLQSCTVQGSFNAVTILRFPGRTVRADIRFKPRSYIRSTDIHTDIRTDIRLWILVLGISERGFYCGYPWLRG